MQITNIQKGEEKIEALSYGLSYIGTADVMRDSEGAVLKGRFQKISGILKFDVFRKGLQFAKASELHPVDVDSDTSNTGEG